MCLSWRLSGRRDELVISVHPGHFQVVMLEMSWVGGGKRRLPLILRLCFGCGDLSVCLPHPQNLWIGEVKKITNEFTCASSRFIVSGFETAPGKHDAGRFQGRFDPQYLQPYMDEYVFRFNRRTCKSVGNVSYVLFSSLFHQLRSHGLSSSCP
jgi:hypothetical protein